VDLNIDSVLDNMTSGGREFHVRDAAVGKAQSPMVRRRVEGTTTADVDVQKLIIAVFTVRRYALHGLSYRNSVCPSVCHTRALCPHGSTYDHDFFTV